MKTTITLTEGKTKQLKNALSWLVKNISHMEEVADKQTKQTLERILWDLARKS